MSIISGTTGIGNLNVSEVVFQPTGSNNVTLSYELDSPAYVTITILYGTKNIVLEKRVMKSAGTNTFIWDV